MVNNMLVPLLDRMMQNLPALVNTLLKESEQYPNGLSMSEPEEEEGVLSWEVWGDTIQMTFEEDKGLVESYLREIEAS